MIVFDTLDELESYIGAIPEINSVIDVMDHALPYDENIGEYKNPNDKGSHIIEVFVTSSNGFITNTEKEKTYVEICLEGEEIINIDGSVFKLTPGRFLAYSGSLNIKRGLMFSLAVAVKCVRFVF